MKIRFFAAALAAVMSMSLCVGCGNQNDTVTTTTTTEAATTTEGNETTTVTEADKTTASQKSTTKKQTATTTSQSKATYRTMNKTTTTESKNTVVDVTEPTTVTTTKKTQASRTKATAPAWEKYFPIQVEGTYVERSLSINNDLKGKEKVKIASDRATVSMHDCKEYTFNHHPGIALQNGRLFVSFSQAYKDEDSPGQRLSVAYSDDFFNWSDPVVAAPTLDNQFVKGTQTANIPDSFFAVNGTLYYFYRSNSYGPEYFDQYGRFIADRGYSGMVGQGMMVKSTDNGLTWSTPEIYNSRAPGIPTKSLLGQWIAYHAYGISWLDAGKEPNGLYWSGHAGLSSAQKGDADARLAAQNGQLTEDAGYQSPDYVFHTIIRSETGYVWHTESYDNGKTWTDAAPTNFKSSLSMWEFGNLPDGRVFAIGSTNPSNRYPLELWISKDGYNFDTCYILRDEYDIAETGAPFVAKGQNQHCPGHAKGGQYAYPYVVMDDTYLYVSYSRHKEMIEITRVKLSDIK